MRGSAGPRAREPGGSRAVARSSSLGTAGATESGDPASKGTELARLAAWSQPTTAARFVGGRTAAALRRLGVETIEDLLHHVPSRYLDMGDVRPIASVASGEQVTVAGTVKVVRKRQARRGLSILSIGIFDGTGYIFGTWFNQDFVADRLKEGTRAVFSGKAVFEYGELRIAQPLFDVADDDGRREDRVHTGGIIPVYAATEGLSSNMIRRVIRHAIDDFAVVPDSLPVGVRLEQRLPSRAAALCEAHFPPDAPSRDDALRRLVFEELFVMQVGIALRRHHITESVPGICHRIDDTALDRLSARLPFELTRDQRTAIGQIMEDMASPRPMNRLLQGEVGSGKTAVAMNALVAAVAGGHQAAIMVPTEVLAAQHYRKVEPVFSGVGVRTVFLTGSSTSSEKTEAHGRIRAGDADVIVGTHALIQDAVDFDRLGLVVIDEQHRFGVRQRLEIREKGANPDVLVMTATPIPRTLALTLYGDLDVSVLRELPGGRRIGEHVTTAVCDRRHRDWAYEKLRSEVRAGRQAYVVCPVIEESEKLNVKAVTEELERLKGLLPDLRIGLVHGRLKPAEKTQVMEQFSGGQIDVLLATTVIEVGIDVPNATVMMVEDAERFGLSQLHQLRGRIGRGVHRSHCILFADPATDESKQRMDAIANIADGFELAEADMRIRGEGQLFGPRQAGLPDLRVARLGRDHHILEAARDAAQRLVSDDPTLAKPQHGPLAEDVGRRFAERMEWVASG